VSEHERDGAAWKAEWAVLPQACTAAATALALAVDLVGGLRVDAERMRANLDAQRGYVLAEGVMLALAERIGKDQAHTLVYEAAARGNADGLPFREALLADPQLTTLLPAAGLDELLQPERAFATIDPLIDRVLRP